MTVRVSRRTPPADDAAKAVRIARRGGCWRLTGDLRRLRKVQRLLDGQPHVSTVLGSDGRTAVLFVAPPSRVGRVMDRVS